MLGADTAAEWQLIDQVGGSPNRFFQLAQRIAWGITQPDIVRVDVIDAARRLVKSHGSQFPAHLLDAWVWRVREPERAERALATARSLASPDHPLAYLLPTEAEWRAETPVQQMVEAAPGVWRVRHLFEMQGGPFHIRTTATIVRTASGDLAIFNPVALSDDTAAQIAALGPVRWICSQGKAHSAYLEPTRRRFPGAQTLATEGHLTHPGAAHLQIDGLLGRVALPSELELIPIEGHLLQEICVFHRPSSTLITQDLFTDRTGDTPWIGRLYSFAWGVSKHVGFASYAPPMWMNIKKLHASTRALRDSGFTRHATAHGSEQIDDPSSIAAMRAGLDFVLGLSPAGHKLLVARFFAAQPGFLRDMLLYLRATKQANGAKLRSGDH